ncbi:MAG: NUDIX domain-containing protein [Epulopiscium sp.]|nr:NUDIX domain-containing protein [Candidatus Epulonipiscium sp.]
MINVVSCGGVVIHNGKILVLYKEYKNKYTGWVLPKGKVEDYETHEETARREVKEEASVEAKIMDYIGPSNYKFNGRNDVINKTVHWYLMQSYNFYAKPQREEYFVDVGYYKYNEAYHLLKFADEKQMLKKGYDQYIKMRKNNQW